MNINTKLIQDLLNIKSQKIKDCFEQYVYEVNNFKPFVDIIGLVIGYVSECQRIEGTHLSACKVYTGKDTFDVVCGAPNVRKGQYIIFSPVGTVLPSGLLIKEVTIRGYKSQGMICSLNELGLPNHFISEEFKDGIFYFDDLANPKNHLGKDPLSLLCLDSFVMDYDLPPNRSDLMSAYGIAREIASILGTKVNNPLKPVGIKNNPLEINLEHIISYYSLYSVKNLTIKESPWWLKTILMGSNIRPINNLVDISNYIMIKYGIPNHFFDADIIGSRGITVRKAFEKQVVKTLDDCDRVLTKDDVLICCSKFPIALAGVMGLKNSMITKDTKNVLIEFAKFDSLSVAQTSKRLQLSTDSSIRFEKYIDDSLISEAVNECLYLLTTLASGVIDGMTIIDNRIKKTNKIIPISIKNIKKFSGSNINLKKITSILNTMDYKYLQNKTNKDLLEVNIPLYRTDIANDADLKEEIFKRYGYHNINPSRLTTSLDSYIAIEKLKERKIKEILCAIGLNEVIGYTLIKESDCYLGFDNTLVLKPLNDDHKYLRTSLLSSLVYAYETNVSLSNENINLFEVGKVFHLNQEKKYLGILISNKLVQTSLEPNNLEASFSLLKGVLTKLFEEFYINFRLEATALKNSRFHPYQCASIIINDKIVGYLGKLILPKDKSNVYALEIDLDFILCIKNEVKFTPISKYPETKRDIAVIVDKNISSKMIEDVIMSAAKKYLTNIVLFDVFLDLEDKSKKSLAYHLSFGDNETTLDTQAVDKLMKSIIFQLDNILKASIRQ